MARWMRLCLTASIGVLALAGGLLSGASASALAPPGGIEQFSFSSMEDYPTTGFALGPEGNIWFTESTLSANVGKVALITPEGKILEYKVPTIKPATETEPEFSSPVGLAKGAGDDLWFTDSATNDMEQRLIGQVALGKGEPQITEFPIPKENYPNQIAAGPEGNMWFTDSGFGGGARIGRITPKGTVTIYPLPSPGHFSELGGIAQGPGGYMWFTERGENEEHRAYIGRISTTTEKVEEFPIPTPHSYPGGIAAGPDGDMWFVESGAAQIGEITPTGEIKEFQATSANYALTGIAAGPDGDMWFGQEATDSIGRITPTGEVKEFPIPNRSGDPQGIVQGADGNMWFMEGDATEIAPTPGSFYHVGRLTTPFLPASLSPPAISGTATQGQALTASQGSWSNDPSAFAYQWQECDSSGNDCSNLGGETGVTHFLSAADVGHTLRVVVSATGVAGTAAAVSVPSAVVASPPPPPKATPRVESSMTWTFGWTRKFTIVQSLVVHGVPEGGRVEVTCHGHGCPFGHHDSATVARHQAHPTCHKHEKCGSTKHNSKKPPPQGPEVGLTGLLKGRHLKVGTSLSVRIVKPGWIGKSFVFTMRSRETPSVQSECLAPGSGEPGKGC